MKIIPMVPACQNMAELKKLTDLVCECVHPDMIVLFGHYAGMNEVCIHRGYEFLVITREPQSETYRDVLSYINEHHPQEVRTEKYLSVYLFTVDSVQQMTSRSYFLMSIRREGILLYRSEECSIQEHHKWKPNYALRHTANFTGHAMKMGKALLADAERNYEMQIYRLTAFYLYQAAIEFTHAAVFAHYGFLPNQSKDLFNSYMHIRQCTKELAELWNTPRDETGVSLLRRLAGYKRYISADYVNANPDSLSQCIEKVKILQIIAERFCSEKLLLLKNLQNT